MGVHAVLFIMQMCQRRIISQPTDWSDWMMQVRHTDAAVRDLGAERVVWDLGGALGVVRAVRVVRALRAVWDLGGSEGL